MIVFPNGKINLGLYVTRHREDGYHDIQTVFYPIPFFDALEIQRSDEFIFKATGIASGEPAKNLCVKAYELLKAKYYLPPVYMHLHKVLPAGGGLGGGSSDAAFTLKLLNEIFELRLTEKSLFEYALQLGSDCPFFLLNKACFAYGRGEELKPAGLSLKGYYIKLVLPGICVSTSDAFKMVMPNVAETDLTKAVTQPISEWKHILKNVFEIPVFSKHPELKNIKENLYEEGALYASMSGSGSTMFGIFDKCPVVNSERERAFLIKG